VTAFVNMVAVLQQNPGIEWTDLIEKIEVREDRGDDMADIDELVGATPVDDDLPPSVCDFRIR
jgi:hypothetical protein